MKNKRHEYIKSILSSHSVTTQEALRELLLAAGFMVTQATVSRDINELGLLKSNGAYALPSDNEEETRLYVILRQAARSVEDAKNLVVIKTLSGMGSAVGAAIDAFGLEGVVGTLAGDDTLLIITKNEENADALTKKIINILNGK